MGFNHTVLHNIDFCTQDYVVNLEKNLFCMYSKISEHPVRGLLHLSRWLSRKPVPLALRPSFCAPFPRQHPISQKRRKLLFHLYEMNACSTVARWPIFGLMI